MSLDLRTLKFDELDEKVYSKFRFCLVVDRGQESEPTNCKSNSKTSKDSGLATCEPEKSESKRKRKSHLSGFCLHFDVTFFSTHPKESRLLLSTKGLTHWHHSLFELDQRLDIFDDFEMISGNLKIFKKKDCLRNMVFRFEFEQFRVGETEGEGVVSKEFCMS